LRGGVQRGVILYTQVALKPDERQS
jgi:hypothetical protein